MHGHLAAAALLAVLAGCATPRLEGSWYLDHGQPTWNEKTKEYETKETHLQIAVRNHADHSEGILSFSLDPVAGRDGRHGTFALEHTVYLAPGQVLVVDADRFDYPGDAWAQPEFLGLQLSRPVHTGDVEDKACAAPLRLIVTLANGGTYELAMPAGMPSQLDGRWLTNCMARKRESSTTPAASAASAASAAAPPAAASR